MRGTLLLLAMLVPAWATAQAPDTSGGLSSEVIPAGISPEVFRHGLAAHKEATIQGRTTSLTLAIIDYSLPATEKRLWVVDVITRQVLESEYVAHGEGSGDLLATRFSNADGTHQSSLGTFVTGGSYEGVRGHSLRLYGLEPGINDNAYARGLVIHGTPGVSESRALRGSQGRTEGCPAVPAASARRLISRLANGSVVFAWYPDREFLEKSVFLDRGAVAERLAAGAQ
ncbi:MAG TPA: murein L,D-transpeptidase catalytic domain family protein [Gemmatimonadales bacterium]|nr:murein L,D-transpeptidase catalytic domain family protein [Gemmatimonadales bacterium]